MDNLKQAYAALGLPENSSRESVEKRYDILLRQARSQQQRGEESIDEALVHQAYRFIIQDDRKKSQDEYNLKTYGKHKKHAESVEKVDHFFQYYKLHVIGAILVILLIVFGIKGYVDHRAEQDRLSKLPPPDLSVLFFGEFNADYDSVEEVLLPLFPEWERIDGKVVYVPLEPKNEYDMAMLQKSTLALVTEKPELFVMDRGNFLRLMNQGLFIPLEDLDLASNELVSDSDIALRAQTEEDTTDHLYAIDLTEALTEIFPQLGREMVIGITLHADENMDNAIQFIEYFLEEMEQ
jgi:hypothetical protein